MSVNNSSELVDLVDERGIPVRTKARKDIDKSTDLFHSVHIVLVTPEKVVIMSQVPLNNSLPNLYVSCISSTVATIRRHQETAEHAARRALATDIYLNNPEIQFIGEGFTVLSDGRKGYFTVYKVGGEIPKQYDKTAIQGFMPSGAERIDRGLKKVPFVVAPTFAYIWQQYKQELVG